MAKVNPPFVRSPYNYDRKEASDACAYVETMPSLTVQEHAIDADINVLVARFGITGTMPPNHRVPEFGDYSEVGDFRSALDAVAAAQEHFMEMPWEVRARFHNDPQEFLDFCSVKDNLPEMQKLGLAIVPPVADTTLADVVKAVEKIVPRGANTDGKGGGSG